MMALFDFNYQNPSLFCVYAWTLKFKKIKKEYSCTKMTATCKSAISLVHNRISALFKSKLI